MSMQDTGAQALTVSDLDITINHEPRISDLRLAERLGYGSPRQIRRLIERHREALERFGEVSRHRDTKPPAGSKGGRPPEGFWLNKRQALYLCTKSDTPHATEATIEMVEVFDAFTAGRAAPARPALPPPAEPPFCQGCAARVLWHARPAAEHQLHVLRDGPITGCELAQIAVFRCGVKQAAQDLLDKALAAGDAAARNTLKSLP